MKKYVCPYCEKELPIYKNPFPTVDVIVYHPDRGVVLVRRGKEPFGYALPGGFMEIGETVEQGAVREVLEETNLHITLDRLLGVYSDPSRDPRFHTISTVFVATAANPEAVLGGDDAAEAGFFPLTALPSLVFDHGKILEDFIKSLGV